MGFLAKGERIIIRSGSDLEDGNYIFKAQTEGGSFEDEVWGTKIEDFEVPIQNSTWTSYESYKYICLGSVRQIYSDIHTFNRNTRFDSTVKVLANVTPVDGDISGIQYITAAIKGSQSADISTLVQTLISELSAQSYTDVIAIGRMNRDVEDYRPVNIDANDIRTYSGFAQCVQDYNLPTTEAIYLINIALISNADIELLTSLSLNIYKQYFVEFLGDGFVAPGTVGKTEIDPDYKAERAINNHIIVITDDTIVDSGTTIVLSPDETIQIDNNSIYYIYFSTTNTSSISKVSLGYYDLDSEEYVSTGTKYDATVVGTISNKLCIAYCINNEFIIREI